jgi:hypothetical protein
VDIVNIRTVNIKGRAYVDVAERVRLVHETRESFEMVSSGPLQVGPMWVWQAIIMVDGKQFIGTAEIKFDAPKHTADGTNPVACAETSAVGRALGMAGLGSLESISSADEVMRAISEQETSSNDEQQDETVKAVSKPLYNAALQAKQRALKLGVITDDLGWTSLLSSLGITEIATGKDIAMINNKITETMKAREQQTA